MRKRSGCLLLCLILALPLLSRGELLLSEPLIEEQMMVQAIAADGQGGLLISTDRDGLLHWRPGEPELAQIPLPVHSGTIGMVVGDGGSAWYIDIYRGQAIALKREGAGIVAGVPLRLDYEDLLSEGGILHFAWASAAACLMDGGLWWLTERGPLYRFNLTDGSRRAYEAGDACWISPGPQGRLLVQVKEVPDDTLELLALDPASGEYAGLGAFPAVPGAQGGVIPFCWDEERDSLYFPAGQALYRAAMADRQPVVCARLPAAADFGIGRCPVPLAVPAPGVCAVVTDSGVAVQETGGQAGPVTQLTVSGSTGGLYFEGLAVKRAALALPDIAVAQQWLYWERDAFNLALITGVEQPDLFLLSTAVDGLAALIDKGYLAELTDAGGVADAVSGMWPQVRRAVTRGDKVYALPIRLDFNTWIARDNALREAGFAPPQDFFAYCDLLDKWYGGLMDEYPDWTPQPTPDDPVLDVVRTGYRLYTQYMRGEGQALRFDTPLFRRMMTRALALRPDGERLEVLEMEELLANPHAAASFRMDVLTTGSMYRPDMERVADPQRRYAEFALPVSADAGLPAWRRGDLVVLAVNPRSPNRQAALRYLSAFAAGLDWRDLLLLGAGEPRDVPNPGHARQVAAAQEEMEAARAALSGLEGAALREAEAALAQRQQAHDDALQAGRLLLSRDEAQAARDRATVTYVLDADQSPEYHPDMLALLDRLASGGLTLDLYIWEADSRLRLMEAETR